MKTKQATLAVLGAVVAAESASSCFAFVDPHSRRHQKLSTQSSKKNMHILDDSIAGWRTPGKPRDHPDYRRSEHIINLDPEEYYDIPTETLPSEIEPLPVDAKFSGARKAEHEAGSEIPFGWDTQLSEEEIWKPAEEDQKLKSLLQEAKFLAEEVEMRVKEEQALVYSEEEEELLKALPQDELGRLEARRLLAAKARIRAEEEEARIMVEVEARRRAINGARQLRGEAARREEEQLAHFFAREARETTGPLFEPLEEEPQYEVKAAEYEEIPFEGDSRLNDLLVEARYLSEEVKRRASEAQTILDTETKESMSEEELARMGAQKFLAKAAKIKAEQEEAKIMEAVEARKQSIEKARHANEAAAERAEARSAKLSAQEEVRRNAAAKALQRVEERARNRDEEEARLLEEERKMLSEGSRLGDQISQPRGVSLDDLMRVIG